MLSVWPDNLAGERREEQNKNEKKMRERKKERKEERKEGRKEGRKMIFKGEEKLFHRTSEKVVYIDYKIWKL
jgi:hypothetical protein